MLIGAVGGVLATWQANRTRQLLLPPATLINIFVLGADNDEILIAAWDGNPTPPYYSELAGLVLGLLVMAAPCRVLQLQQLRGSQGFSTSSLRAMNGIIKTYRNSVDAMLPTIEDMYRMQLPDWRPVIFRVGETELENSWP
jgi:hypothetical protein